jgi:hypothetical protein
MDDKSEFNYAVNFLNRINGWLCIAGEQAYNCIASDWFHALLNVYREMADEMDAERFAWFESNRIEINNIIIAETAQSIKNVIKPELYEKLHLFEIELRKEIKKSGFKTKYKEDILTPESEWSQEET